jgi:uncharacterized damage-inducible protein DinB
MTEQASPLITFYKQGWENYQQALVKTIAPLSSEQLALPIAPHHWPIGMLLTHLIDARVSWFYGWMGEESADMARWHEERSRDEPAAYGPAELVAIFERTWHVMADAMSRWTSADLAQLFPPPAAHQAWLQDQGLEEEPPHTRQWIVWHVLEHEIHHGGELSLALGTYGLDDFYTW